MMGNERTTEIRAGFQLDEAALTAWLKSNVEGFRGPLSIDQFSGGQSNPTFRLTTPDAKYVLRRKPMGQLLKGAHAVDREARVMRALGAAGIPVPRVRALCTDDGVIGSWFYVMELVEGRIFWDGGFPGATPDQRSALQGSMGATLAAIHTLLPDDVGLGDYGRPSGYLERQV
ncbi:MAG: phosphotransferase family protein, partial [Gammaproteobacteria bacterium]|nr:phosphotransferase family protein [Gammaproteobacteria bacterium]